MAQKKQSIEIFIGKRSTIYEKDMIWNALPLLLFQWMPSSDWKNASSDKISVFIVVVFFQSDWIEFAYSYIYWSKSIER